MPKDFRERIRISLANETLQIALDANAERRVSGRMAAFASLPDWRERRQRAHAVRADMIDHLDPYLDAFIEKAAQNRMVVHRARDAAEAIEIVLRIVKNAPERTRSNTKEIFVPLRGEKILIAKSKSMVSEEINLNHALEAQGIRVVETDLGEYIVQLRNERPTHIITPAVHLRRQEIGQLFHEKLGIPYTEDIPTLIHAARLALRQIFLSADIGISGVNFGVVETGTLCLVTNEGNGRMVTTLPPVHIALMGMERLVRNYDDLALMLSLLPRSATTQKLSVYTQLIHSPCPDQQRHLIILDNGRTRLRSSPLKESLYCIRCGACLNACPVFREIGGHGYRSVYPGPIGSVISAGFFGSDFVPLAQASSLCGACRDACPVDIDLPKLLTRVRAGEGAETGKRKEGDGLSRSGRLFMQVYSHIARNPRRFAAAQKLADLGSRLMAPFSPYIRLPALTGWGYSKDLPRFAGKTFRGRWAALKREENTYTRKAAHHGPDQHVSIEDRPAEPASRTQRDLVARFTQELTTLNGTVTRTNAVDLPSKVIEFLRDHNINQIHLEPHVLDEHALHQAGINLSRTPDPAIRLGVTKAICAAADTGSILVVDGEGDPLTASLLPEIHIAVLHTAKILPSLEDVLKLPIIAQSRSAVIITGPSRTADIEMSLTIGMHGPRELQVFLVDD
ncbi:MAG TPA: LUD domain-containing protein [Anaerolineales bacterium]|nr:LUD domain-containing protein [Anaerolineales bacterium]